MVGVGVGVAVGAMVGVAVGVTVGVAVAVAVGVGVGVGVAAISEVAFPVRKIFAPPPSLSVSMRSTVLGGLTFPLLSTNAYVSGPSSATVVVGAIDNVPVPS